MSRGSQRYTGKIKGGKEFGVVNKKSNVGAKLGSVLVVLLVLGGGGGGYYFYNNVDGLIAHVELQDELAVPAAYALAHRGPDARAIMPLRAGLEKGRPALKRACAKALGATRNAENTPFLGKAAVNDSDPTVRAAAARAIGANGQLNVELYLEKALEDGNDDVKIAAMDAVGDLKLGAGIPYLIGYLRYSNSYVKTSAQENLEKFLGDGRSFGSSPEAWQKWYDGEYE